ncbi:pilus assembly protein [Pokkaliibacter plantistimulans]|uniref:Pilus assembly protein n=1 Tax=Proteobacteria bacterium 228 TaxID=2083153 RepID=A0A2S5KSU7_9PROT|nr:PilC/PilY family type IV pilus protein [Pokkaliibacter plantistimulans]PPC77735.1 pilus assembly protein [Pokkaliibacter plantistimulans]
MKRSASLRQRLTALALGFLCAALPLRASLASVDIASTPLLLGTTVAPNIMFLLDDSGSMQWEFMPDSDLYYSYYLFPRPDSVYGGATYTNQVPSFSDTNLSSVHDRSSNNNAVFYNPYITYTPWKAYDGSSMGNASPTAAYYNPSNTSAGTLNLTTQQSQYAYWFYSTTSRSSAYYATSCKSGNTTTYNCSMSYYPITFYMYKGSGSVETISNYIRYQIRGSSAYKKDLSGSTESSVTSFTWGTITRTVTEERQNFANWFQYYRSRVLAARAGASIAFANLGSNYRVGFRTINGGTTQYIPTSGTFSSTNKQNFYSNLLTSTIGTNGTPLRGALQWAGEYYSGNKSGVTDPMTPTSVSCRQNYAILTTDGYWNGSLSSTVGNVDNSSGSKITSSDGNTSYTYSPVAPYKDDYSDTLADIAMTYWKKDIRTDLANNVTTSTNDPAFWQHMVTFGISIGVSGSLDPDSDLSALTAGTKSWPNPTSSDEYKIDDLWHATVNSRGSFVAASDPEEFATALQDALNTIASRTSTNASLTNNGNSLETDSMLFQPRYYSGDWTGDLWAYDVSDSSVDPVISWKASKKLPSYSARNIVLGGGSTYTTVDFSWSSLASGQQSVLGSSAVVNYLRGNTASEISNGGSYRNRTTVLGDFVDSNPFYQDVPSKNYYRYHWTGASSYSAFKVANASRQDMVYVGGNDGMLHGFAASGTSAGKELMAYIPSEMLSKLPDLTSSSYTHEYMMDGDVTVGDAYISSAWKSVLVGSTGRGGKSLFALDVTDPTSFSASKVLWEYTDTDLGQFLGTPVIARLNNGTWAAIVGNGYNGTSNTAELLVINLETGKLIKKIDTGIGTAADPNGLASVAGYDSDRDGNFDYFYAGDLYGNVWKFDLSSTSSTSDWGVAYSGEPLFTAEYTDGSSDTRQPVTAGLALSVDSSSGSLWVFFGTGIYLGTADPDSKNVQAIYGISDTGSAFTGNSNLLKLKIQDEYTNSDGLMVRSVVIASGQSSKTSTRGWYLNLISPNNGSEGERVIYTPQMVRSYLVTTTLIPDDDDCSQGGSSYTMGIYPYMTSASTSSKNGVFDINNDGTVDASDKINSSQVGSGIGSSSATSNGSLVGNKLYSSDNSGNVSSSDVDTYTNLGKTSWREIRNY